MLRALAGASGGRIRRLRVSSASRGSSFRAPHRGRVVQEAVLALEEGDAALQLPDDALEVRPVAVDLANVVREVPDLGLQLRDFAPLRRVAPAELLALEVHVVALVWCAAGTRSGPIIHLWRIGVAL